MMLEVGGLIITSLVVLLCWFLLKSDRSLSATEDMIGLEAVAQENFVKEGFVLVRGELWRAKLRSGMVHKGDAVEIVGVGDGLYVEIVKNEK
jgi:membrane-bound ClpP family serine protease